MSSSPQRSLGDRDLIARAVIWKDGALLVNANTNAKTGEDYLALPGGHVDAGENCRDALTREIEEELAARAQVSELLFVCESVYAGRKKSETRRHELTLFFAASIEGEDTRPDGSIVSPEAWKRFRWLPADELESANLLPRDAREWLSSQLDGNEAPRYSWSDLTSK